MYIDDFLLADAHFTVVFFFPLCTFSKSFLHFCNCAFEGGHFFPGVGLFFLGVSDPGGHLFLGRNKRGSLIPRIIWPGGY